MNTDTEIILSARRTGGAHQLVKLADASAGELASIGPGADASPAALTFFLHRETRRLAPETVLAQRAAVVAFNKAFHPAIDLLWPVDAGVARDLAVLAALQNRPEIAEQFRKEWAL